MEDATDAETSSSDAVDVEPAVVVACVASTSAVDVAETYGLSEVTRLSTKEDVVSLDEDDEIAVFEAAVVLTFCPSARWSEDVASS